MMTHDSTGLDVTFGESRCLSVITSRKADGQLDFYVAGIGVDTHAHGFLELDGERFDFGVRLKDRGDHAGPVRIRGSSEATNGELGRLSVEAGATECRLAVTHGSSALTTAEAMPTDSNAHRERFPLPGDPSERNTFELRWASTEPPDGEDRVSKRLFGGDRPLWLEARRISSDTTGG